MPCARPRKSSTERLAHRETCPGVPRARSFKRTTARPAGCWAGCSGWLLGLQQPHVGGLGALRPRCHVELDGLTLIK
jgi:hypothetical protein